MYMDIIDKVISTQATRANVRRAIPVLVYWATTGQTNRRYNDLIKALGYTRFSGIGHVLGCIQEVINALTKETGKTIPTLNTLCKRDGKTDDDMLPADGFDYVEPNYSSLSDESKKAFVAGLDRRAVEYKNWDWVLSELDLTPYTPFTSNEVGEISNPTSHSSGGEGSEHKKLKDYILNNPHKIGLKNISERFTEYLLPSGDKLDVYFRLNDGSVVAVEIKSSVSDNADITRGIFQSVKYQAVLEAMQRVVGSMRNITVLLVTGRELADIHNKLISTLSINHKLITVK